MDASVNSEGILLQAPISEFEQAYQPIAAGASSSLCCMTVNSEAPTFSAIQPEDNLITFRRILWAQKSSTGVPGEVEISYVRKEGDRYTPMTSIVRIPSTEKVSEILDRAYPDSMPGPSILVLINPHGGQGNAAQIFDSDVQPILQAAHCRTTILHTSYSGHATDIVRNLDIDKYDMIMCASGDGIPHEVINGLYKREDRARAFDKLVVTQVPSGSGNAMALSCLGTQEPSKATVLILKGAAVRNDLMAICTRDGSVKLSFLSQTYGIVAQADIGTEWMRWLGDLRFNVGVTTQVISRAKYPCSLAVKYIARSKQELSDYYRSHVTEPSDFSPLCSHDFQLKYADEFVQVTNPEDISNMAGWEKLDEDVCNNLCIFYSGKMPYMSKDTNFFPAALPHDGSIDVVVSDVRSGIMKTFDALMSCDKGLHVWKEDIAHIKVEAYRFVPHFEGKKKPFVSIDGENFPLQPFQVEVLHGVMKTVMTGGSYTETGFLEQMDTEL